MSELISRTVVPAQPGYFKICPWRDDNGEVKFRRESIVAWVISIYSGYRDDQPHSVCADPVVADTIGSDLGRPVAILNPEGFVEETDEAILPLREWLDDPKLFERFERFERF